MILGYLFEPRDFQLLVHLKDRMMGNGSLSAAERRDLTAVLVLALMHAQILALESTQGLEALNRLMGEEADDDD